MIIKIKTRNKPTYFQLLSYMMNDKDRLFDKSGKSFVLTHNMRGNSISSWVNQFKAVEKNRLYRRSDNTMLFHEIVSFSPGDSDNITIEKLQDIAQQYIKERNPKGLFVAVPHFDKGHYHIHFCVSGVERSGKSMRLERVRLKEMKLAVQKYQIEKYGELSHSVVKHGKGGQNISDNEYQLKKRGGKTENERIISILKNCYKKANSKNDFFKLLENFGLTTYVRGGQVTGILDERNKKHRLKKFGFSKEQIEKLNKSQNRAKELGETRGKKVKNRGRYL